MGFATRRMPLFALLLAATQALPFCPQAQASDYEVGESLVCDTQAQVERFVAVFAGNAKSAIKVVNAEEQNPSACAVVNVAFRRGTQIGIARHGDSAFAIVRILVVGVETDDGIRPVRPAAYFSLFGVREYAV